MKFKEREPEPVRRPQLTDARVMGDVRGQEGVTVAVGAVGFMFWRDGEDWTGGDAVTLGRGTELTEDWLRAARTVAVEAMRRDIAGVGGDEAAADTVACAECGRLLCSTLLAGVDARVSVDCGPSHVVRFRDGRELVFAPDGGASWAAP